MNRKKAMLAMAGMLITGCAAQLPPPDPSFAATRPVVAPPPQPSNGAIYHPGYEISLFTDFRAQRVGDVLTIVLEERTTGEKGSDTAIDRNTSYSLTNPTLLGSGVQFNTPNWVPLASNQNNSLEMAVKSKGAFSGSGDSSQNNRLSGHITVTVAEVLPNGNLVVRGEKVITINHGNEYIKISGIVNRRYINPDNTVSSLNLADARIAYVGDGATQEANRMGWLSRFFFSRFMPF
ncbi:flagellar basal body L-ring protein FlgH [Nitrosococcus watsonii]|uniref:Flagellar L-ring protein n=1 Tax=Nitrosococcus watsoni (strain C-113) TaxID=105559 RepID=D8K8D0_NITWC|nr:flagellar basal body L-ring protein FlgH [Nitrosococcus watsonii]ADJ29050.1 flagellar L-ring protein [Nitrosococcus watsonii C-113]